MLFLCLTYFVQLRIAKVKNSLSLSVLYSTSSNRSRNISPTISSYQHRGRPESSAKASRSCSSTSMRATTWTASSMRRRTTPRASTISTWSPTRPRTTTTAAPRSTPACLPAKASQAEYPVPPWSNEDTGKWDVLQDCSDESSYTFDPDKPGTYRVCVNAREVGSTAEYERSRTFSITK